MQAQQGSDGGHYKPTDAHSAGLAAKRRIEEEMGWWDKPWNWR
jgi:hypothetical protein